MELLLVGRVVQGSAGGLLAGLGYAVINSALPQSLWTKASALVSAMWGVGTLLGPAAGGLFAQYGSWRWAFGVLVALAAAIAVLVPFSLARRTTPVGAGPHSRVVAGAAGLRGVRGEHCGIPRSLVWTAALLALGAALVAVFLFVDRRTAAGCSPQRLSARAVEVDLPDARPVVGRHHGDMYVPLFGQRLAHLTPVAAGFLGVGLAIGWTVERDRSASMSTTRVIRRTVAVAPLVMATGLGMGALSQFEDASGGLIAIWAVALLMTGVGVGIAWPHLSAWAMSCVDDPARDRRRPRPSTPCN